MDVIGPASLSQLFMVGLFAGALWFFFRKQWWGVVAFLCLTVLAAVVLFFPNLLDMI